MTAKIMKEAREQNEDLEAEENVLLASTRNHSQQAFPYFHTMKDPAFPHLYRRNFALSDVVIGHGTQCSHF